MAALLMMTAPFAQSEKYVGAMKKSLADFGEAKTAEQLMAVSASFQRIADAEKTQWLPYYYAALTQVMRGHYDPKLDKDEVANGADALVAKAEAIDGKNAEIFIVKNMSATMHMLVDPMARWQAYGAKAGEALAMAKKLDPQNPRIYYLEGQGIFGMPENFGGGKANAKPLFEKSVKLFETYKPATELSPMWGKDNAEQMLAACQ